MQATGTFREAGLSKGFVIVVIAMLCALLLGGVGGYLARSVDTGAGVPTYAQPAVESNQGGPDSDLTRALPTAAPQGGPDSDLTRALPTAGPADAPYQPDYGIVP